MMQETKVQRLSLLDLMKRKKRWSDFLKSKKGIALTLLLFVFLYIGYVQIFAKNADTSTVSTEQEVTVQKRNLRVSIDTDGTLQNSADTKLSFGTAGTIKEVFVVQGQKVKARDKIAQLETDTLEFDLKKAELSLRSAEANFLSKKSPSTAADILIAQKNIESAEDALENTIRQNELDIKNAEIALASAKRNYEAVQKEVSGNTTVSDSDLRTAQINVENAKNDLEIAKSNAENTQKIIENSIQQAYENAVLKIDSSINDMLTALQEADRVLEEDMKDGYGIGYLLGAKNPSSVTDARSAYIRSRSLYENFVKQTNALTVHSSHDEVSSALTSGIGVLKEIDSGFSPLLVALDNTISDNTFSSDKIASIRSSSSSAQSKIKSSVSSLTLAQQSITTTLLSQQTQLLSSENAVKSAENKLITAENALSSLHITKNTSSLKDDNSLTDAEESYESTLRQFENTKFKAEISLKSAQNQVEIAKAQFEIKMDPLTKGDILSLDNQIESARIGLENAKYNLEKATIISPIDGDIAQINANTGETVKTDSTDPIAVIVSKNSFELEVSIEEADIGKVQVGQKAYASFDALDSIEIEGEVSFISNTAETDSNGIVTYLVRIPITGENETLRAGMTAQVGLILSESSQALSIPVSAVKNVNGKPSVKNTNGEWIPVSTGFTDGEFVEILSGLSEGEKILSPK